MKFIPIDPNQFPDLREGRRGRVSYPLLKSFLETGLPIAMLDRTGMQQSLQSLNSSLGAYIRSHELPIRLANRGGEVYLIRTDADAKGKTKPLDIANAKKSPAAPGAVVATPVTPSEIGKRFAQEKGQVTK